MAYFLMIITPFRLLPLLITWLTLLIADALLIIDIHYYYYFFLLIVEAFTAAAS